MISTFEIYLIMNAEDFKVGLLILGMLGIVGIGIRCMVTEEYTTRLKQLTAVCTVLLVLAFMLPGTKTLLAMYVVPKIVNNEELKGEALELYYLYKKSLEEKSK